MSRKEALFEDGNKSFFEGPEPGTLIQHFKDDLCKHRRNKDKFQKVNLPGKGALNSRISEFFMSRLQEIGVETHFVKRLNMREQLVQAAEEIPLKIAVRNIAAGSFAKRFDLDEGMTLPRTVVEFIYKGQERTIVSEDHITLFGWATAQEIDDMTGVALRVNDFLQGLFLGIGIHLMDFKLEFGRIAYDYHEETLLIITDEITPDVCRLVDMKTGERFGKDRFIKGLSGLSESYQDIARRLKLL